MQVIDLLMLIIFVFHKKKLLVSVDEFIIN